VDRYSPTNPRQLNIGIVGDDTEFLSNTLLDPSGRVELVPGDDFDIGTGLVAIGSGLGTQETDLLNMFVSSVCDNKDGVAGPQ